MEFIDRYFEQTRSPLIELTRHFFSGLLQPESAGSEGSFVTWMVQILAVLVAASWYIPVQLFQRYAILHVAGDEAEYRLAYSSDTLFALVTMAILVALVTVLEWSALFPSRKDQLVLTPLPLTRQQLFGAKLAALLLFVSLFIVAITVLSALALPGIAGGTLETRSLSIRILGMLLGTVALSYFVFLALLAFQGILLTLLPMRWFESVSFAVQVALLVALLCACPLLPYFPSGPLMRMHPAWLDLFPPTWFLGLADWITGSRSAWTSAMAARAVAALGLAMLLAATGYLISYLQYNRFASETLRQNREARMSFHALFARCFHLPQSRATAGFVLSILTRGRQQKLVFLLIFGIGVALVLESSVYASLHPVRIGTRGGTIGLQSAIVALPLTLSFFAMVGMRRVFRLPSELAANWIFRFTEQPELRRAQLDTVFRTFVIWGGLPLLLVCAPAQFAIFGPRAIWILLIQILLMVTLAEHLLRDWRSIPFTCEQNPARRHLMLSASVHIVELSIYSFMSSNIITEGMYAPKVLRTYGFIVLAVFVWLRRKRLREWAAAPLEFTESLSPEVQPLSLTPQ